MSSKLAEQHTEVEERNKRAVVVVHRLPAEERRQAEEHRLAARAVNFDLTSTQILCHASNRIFS